MTNHKVTDEELMNLSKKAKEIGVGLIPIGVGFIEALIAEIRSYRPITFELNAGVEEIHFTSTGKKYYVIAGIQPQLEMLKDKKVRVHVTELR